MCASASSSIRRRKRFISPPHWAPTGWSSTLNRYARAFERGASAAQASFATYAAAAELAHQLGLGINAGHDLNLDNLMIFRELPYLDEVSIGHAIMSRALFVGLDTVVREYLAVLSGGRPA